MILFQKKRVTIDITIDTQQKEIKIHAQVQFVKQ